MPELEVAAETSVPLGNQVLAADGGTFEPVDGTLDVLPGLQPAEHGDRSVTSAHDWLGGCHKSTKRGYSLSCLLMQICIISRIISL